MNRKLDYLCIAETHLFFSLDDEIVHADDGEDTTVAEGKEYLLNHIDDHIKELQEFRNDVATMPYSKFSQKYNG